MTPRRQKWWENLPAEEQRARKFIEWQRELIKQWKGLLNSDITWSHAYAKEQIREPKRAIKALRKQIAMQPWTHKKIHSLHCPRCGRRIYATNYKPLYCDLCGQRLDWKEAMQCED